MLEKFSTRFILAIVVIALAVWFGGTIVRSNIAYELFYTSDKLQIKTEYTNEIQLHTIKLYAYAAAYTGFAYGIAFLGIIYLTIFWRNHLKPNGWLFMAIILFFLTSPIELYFTYLDYGLNQLVLFGKISDFMNPDYQTHFLERFTKYSQLLPISILANATAVFLIIWKPLKYNQDIQN